MTIRYDFSNRAALVIGGTSGIGRAAALGFARAGANVTVAARGEDAAQRTCEALTAAFVSPTLRLYTTPDLRGLEWARTIVGPDWAE